MGTSVFGREAELDAVERFLDATQHAHVPSTALVLEGNPGIGKSAIWHEALSRAHERGIQVLSSRPTEAEARLSYAGLADLIGPVYDRVRDDLPLPQQQALEVALLRRLAGRRTDPRATGTALVSALKSLAASSPVVVAIDDVQWLDRASERALEFAVRRLPPGVSLLVTARGELPGGSLLGLAEGSPDLSLERRWLGSLSVTALHHMIRVQLGAAPTRPTLMRIASASGGNPFYALEIARTLPSADVGSGDAPLPIPDQLLELVAARVAELTDSTREVLLAVAMLFRPSVPVLVAAFGSPKHVEEALSEAGAANVVVDGETGVRFTHPLLASAVHASFSQARQREMQGRLASAVSDPEEQARHLARAVTAPDERTAVLVERAAVLASQRGAQDAAADLYHAAARLTPPARPGDATRRLLGASMATLAAGDPPSARAIAEQALERASESQDAAEALLLLGQVAWVEGPSALSIEYLERALESAGEDRRLQGRIHALLAEYSLTDQARVLEHSAAAVEHLVEGQDPALLAAALLNEAFFSAQLGRGARHDLVQRAFMIEDRAGPDVERNRVGLIWLTCMDETEAARARYQLEDQWYRDRGEEGWRAERLAHLALADFYAGACDSAERAIEESCSLIEQMGQPAGPWGMTFYIRSLIDLHQGRAERARATLLPLREELERVHHRFFAAVVISAIGSLELVSGDPAAAVRAFRQMHAHLDAIGAADPIGLRTDPDEIEALVALGRAEEARAVLAHLEWRHATIPRPWIAGALPRARALVLAADGDVSAGLAACEAPDLASAERVPLEHARTLLVQGRLLRRLKQRRAAADALGEALAHFLRLSAVTWARQAQAELTRTGRRRSASDELTPSELRVAELASTGLRNREIAEAAFLSPKTVEANLARAYRKLGITSRAELGAHMARLNAGRSNPSA